MMKKVILASLLIFNISAYAADLICMGNTNNNQLIQLNVGLDKRLGKVTIENQTYDLSISNDFMHVWQNTIDNQAYTNSLSRIDGSLTVIAENVLVNEQRQPVVRAVLSCKDKKELLF
jgi:hypothetical protein